MSSATGPDGSAPRRRGRRGTGEDTKAQLLVAARAEFSAHGYDGATVRRIAERAGVDAAMVNHWFGGKDSLFTASLQVPVDPAMIREKVLPGDPERLGERIVRMFLWIWDESGPDPFVALLRSVAAYPPAARMMREFVGRVVIAPVVGAVSPDRHAERGALLASQIVGLGMVRYVIQLDPLATAGHDDVVAAIAPTLQRYLTGDLGSMKPDS